MDCGGVGGVGGDGGWVEIGGVERVERGEDALDGRDEVFYGWAPECVCLAR